jgi:hypothetical protein
MTRALLTEIVLYVEFGERISLANGLDPIVKIHIPTVLGTITNCQVST